MTDQLTALYGSWRSPITAELLAESTVHLGEVRVDGDAVYWIETRPSEQGRSVVVRWTAAEGARDVTPSGFSARTRAHEYGGGSYWVDGDTVYFANFPDQILYRQVIGQAPAPLTPAGYRYADGIVDRRRGRIICVREDHTVAGREAENTLVANDSVAGGPGEVIASGHDFYSSPALSPDGTQLCWLAWRHPNMPWTATELWLADVTPGGEVVNARCIEGASGGDAIFQPAWSPDGQLIFVSDRTDWWNLYRWQPEGAQPLAPLAAEFGLPQWIFGRSTYAFVSAQELVCAFVSDGVASLAVLNLTTRRLGAALWQGAAVDGVCVSDGHVVFVGGKPDAMAAVCRIDLASGAVEELRQSSTLTVDPGFLSVPEVIDFPTTGGQTSHAFYYPPQNHLYRAPEGERPPLVVFSHGGPTGATTSTLSLSVQYWTSRGFGVLDVNYRGSTGYGRAYREMLYGQWGIVDVDDCVAGARFLADAGRVDGRRLAIRGGSAGGYTTLMTLVSGTEFAAGASYFGVSDVEALALETHKFESRYMDWLVGPYPAQRDLYLERSPITHADRLASPVIFFQGLDDKIVLPNQAEMMVESLARKGIPVAYIAYEGEGHGFRRGENIVNSLHAELAFYGLVLGFDPADELPEIEIVNRDALGRAR
ncbi:MAG: S9 family peptidase [Caldilineaceae bacterium]|nr:S9 family peptidase [Caldilineaceae bacterium]MCB9118218.1 S9 family peptidase [Caldilineaceae bacterium]MCB9123386.1 S9 family peptidase [Caldilineaceae bacterium]